MRCKATPYQTQCISKISNTLHRARPNSRRYNGLGVILCAWSTSLQEVEPRAAVARVSQLGFDTSKSSIFNTFAWVRTHIGPYPESERIELSPQVLASNEGIVRRLLRDFRKHPLSQKVQDTSLLPLLGDALEDAGVSHNLLLTLCRQASPSALYIIRND